MMSSFVPTVFALQCIIQLMWKVLRNYVFYLLLGALMVKSVTLYDQMQSRRKQTNEWEMGKKCNRDIFAFITGEFFLEDLFPKVFGFIHFGSETH